MKISIIGSGYVGLVTGACFAHLGHQVLCVDNNKNKIRLLKKGKCPIYEPGLVEMIRENSAEGRLSFSTSLKNAVAHGNIIFIAVDTPSRDNGEADLTSVQDVARNIAPYLSSYRLIVEKSTVPVRTSEELDRLLKTMAPKGAEFDVASNPEFLREGSAINDFLRPDRVVIGVNSQTAASLLVQLYEPLNAPLLITDINSAELIKHCANAFLAMKISFINAVARICEKSGADVTRVARGIGLDKRIGTDFLSAGVGFGGSCLPKDISAFIRLSEQLGYDFSLLKEVKKINIEQKDLVKKKLQDALGKLKGKRITIWGLAFKPDTDDVRNAPALEIIDSLLKAGARVIAYDPVTLKNAARALSGKKVKFVKNVLDAAKGADAVVLVTEWDEFKHVNLPELKKIMKNPVFLDGRNLFDPKRMKGLGFKYIGIGR
ncbi:MAG: UDP-glucose/GDP-mannose dehydrogenase family protein [Candidatus Eremiobacteraeota bacterium]|nr:UDP-glucose/GDP-mannose dehydrogenase family protein [Candidatus Eremiobacteraeota bacterium]